MENLNDVNYQHKVNDYVMYKNNGIYEIIDICDIGFSGSDEKKYYMMKAVYDNNTIVYVPMTSDDLVGRMQHILTTEEIHDIINESERVNYIWIDDSKLRAAKFDEILNSENKPEILWLIKTISAKKEILDAQKKKPTASDMRILAKAEKIITEEFAFSLDIELNEVIAYILDHIKTNEKKDA